MRKAILFSCMVFFSLAAWAEEKVLPEGFSPERAVSSKHFMVFHESSYAPAGVLGVLEGLHAKLMLDLASFSPWANREVIVVYLYKGQDSYVAGTGMPGWAGAHVDLATRQVFGYESERFQRTMAHELAHLFFDHYFVSQQAHPPVWLNEGVATLMEWDYGLAGEQERINKVLDRDAAMSLESFFAGAYQYGGDHSSGSVSLWYLQAYSLVKFLMRRFSIAQFSTLCRGLRAGRSLDEALRAAYGLQMTDARALEALWLDNLSP